MLRKANSKVSDTLQCISNKKSDYCPIIYTVTPFMAFSNHSKEETAEKGETTKKTVGDKTERLRIRTWNVRSLNKEGKMVAI